MLCKSLVEQNMNLDLEAAYERSLFFAREHADVTVDRLKVLSALTMKNTGSECYTALDDFSSANGDIPLVNVTAGVGGRSIWQSTKCRRNELLSHDILVIDRIVNIVREAVCNLQLANYSLF